MDARTRERLPVLPVLVRTVDARRRNAIAVLQAARDTLPGQSFTVAGETLTALDHQDHRDGVGR